LTRAFTTSRSGNSTRQELQPNNANLYRAGNNPEGLGRGYHGEKAYEKRWLLTPRTRKSKAFGTGPGGKRPRFDLLHLRSQRGSPGPAMDQKRGEGLSHGQGIRPLDRIQRSGSRQQPWGRSDWSRSTRRISPGISFTSPSTAESSGCYPRLWDGKKAPSWCWTLERAKSWDAFPNPPSPLRRYTANGEIITVTKTPR